MPGVHVYAPGNPKYIAVSVTVLPVTGLTIGTPIFPGGDDYFFAPLQESVKVYSKPFVILVPVTVTNAFIKGRAAGRGRDGDGEGHGGLPGVRRQGVLPAAVAAVLGGRAREAGSPLIGHRDAEIWPQRHRAHEVSIFLATDGAELTESRQVVPQSHVDLIVWRADAALKR